MFGISSYDRKIADLKARTNVVVTPAMLQPITAQNLENMYRAQRYFAAEAANPTANKKLLSQATALAMNYNSLQRYCAKEGIPYYV